MPFIFETTPLLSAAIPRGTRDTEDGKTSFRSLCRQRSSTKWQHFSLCQETLERRQEGEEGSGKVKGERKWTGERKWEREWHQQIVYNIIHQTFELCWCFHLSHYEPVGKHDEGGRERAWKAEVFNWPGQIVTAIHQCNYTIEV